MNILAGIALVLLTVVGYSVGRTCFAMKYKISPSIVDLPVSLLLWVGAFLIPVTVEKGWKILIGFVVAALVGFALTSILPKKEDRPKYKTLFVDDEPPPTGIWGMWKKLSTKMGEFQGRLMLMWLYCILILPFGVLVRLLSDPLKLRPALRTGWLERPAAKTDLDDLRRQF